MCLLSVCFPHGAHVSPVSLLSSPCTCVSLSVFFPHRAHVSPCQSLCTCASCWSACSGLTVKFGRKSSQHFASSPEFGFNIFFTNAFRHAAIHSCATGNTTCDLSKIAHACTIHLFSNLNSVAITDLWILHSPCQGSGLHYVL